MTLEEIKKNIKDGWQLNPNEKFVNNTWKMFFESMEF